MKSRLFVLLVLLVLAPASAIARFGLFNHGGGTPAIVSCAITGVNHSGTTTFTGNPNGDASGTPLGTFSVTTSGTCAAPSWRISDIVNFQMLSSGVPETFGALAPGTYSGITATATIAGATGSPFTSAPVTFTGNGFTGNTLSGTSFAPGASSGTVVGAIGVNEIGGSCGGGCTLSLTGTDAASFQLSSTTLPSNLETQGILCGSPPCSYAINVVATQSGIGASPMTTPFTITSGAVVLSLQENVNNPATGSALPANWFWKIGYPIPKGVLPAGSSLTATIGGTPIRVCEGWIAGAKTETDGSQGDIALILDGSGVAISPGASKLLQFTVSSAPWPTTTSRTDADWEALHDVVQITGMSGQFGANYQAVGFGGTSAPTSRGGNGADMISGNTWQATFDGGATNTIETIGKSPCGYEVWVTAPFVDQTTSTKHAYLSAVMDYLVTEKADGSLGPIASKGPYLYNANVFASNAAGFNVPSEFVFNAAFIRNFGQAGVTTVRSESGVLEPAFSTLPWTRMDGQWDWTANDPGIYMTLAPHGGVTGYNWLARTGKNPPYATSASGLTAYAPGGFNPNSGPVVSISATTGVIAPVASSAGNPFPFSGGYWYPTNSWWPLSVRFQATTLPTNISSNTQYWIVYREEVAGTGSATWNYMVYDNLGDALLQPPQVWNQYGASGTGFTVGCRATLAGGTLAVGGNPAVVTIDSVNGAGGVTQMHVNSGTDQGSYSIMPFMPVSIASTSGCSGSGLLIAVPNTISGGNQVVPVSASTCPRSTGQICPGASFSGDMVAIQTAGLTSSGKLTGFEGNTGGRPDIALMSEFVTSYVLSELLSNSQGYQTFARVQALGQAAEPWHVLNYKPGTDGFIHVPCTLDSAGCPATLLGTGQTATTFRGSQWYPLLQGVWGGLFGDVYCKASGGSLSIGLGGMCGTGTTGPIGADSEHHPNNFWPICLLEADEFICRVIEYNGSSAMAEQPAIYRNLRTNPLDSTICSSGTCYGVAQEMFAAGGSFRHHAWNRRDTGMAYYAAKNGSPEETMFLNDLINNEQIASWYENYKGTGYQALGLSYNDENLSQISNTDTGTFTGTLSGLNQLFISGIHYGMAVDAFLYKLLGDHVTGTSGSGLSWGFQHKYQFDELWYINSFSVPSSASYLTGAGWCPYYTAASEFFAVNLGDPGSATPGTFVAPNQLMFANPNSNNGIYYADPSGVGSLIQFYPLQIAPRVGDLWTPHAGAVATQQLQASFYNESASITNNVMTLTDTNQPPLTVNELVAGTGIAANDTVKVSSIIGTSPASYNLTSSKGNTYNIATQGFQITVIFKPAASPLVDSTLYTVASVGGNSLATTYGAGKFTFTLSGISSGPSVPIPMGGYWSPTSAQTITSGQPGSCSLLSGGTAQAPANSAGLAGNDTYVSEAVGVMGFMQAIDGAGTPAAQGYAVGNSVMVAHDPGWRNVNAFFAFGPSY